MRIVFFFDPVTSTRQRKNAKSWTSDLRALMLCNWATETSRWAKPLLHTARIINVESLMCQIRKWWIFSSVIKWRKMFSASSVTSVERRKEIGLTIFLTILTQTKLLRLLILAVCGICVKYELSKSLSKLTSSLVIEVIERLNADLTHELSNFYFITFRASLELLFWR